MVSNRLWPNLPVRLGEGRDRVRGGQRAEAGRPERPVARRGAQTRQLKKRLARRLWEVPRAQAMGAAAPVRAGARGEAARARAQATGGAGAGRAGGAGGAGGG